MVVAVLLLRRFLPLLIVFAGTATRGLTGNVGSYPSTFLKHHSSVNRRSSSLSVFKNRGEYYGVVGHLVKRQSHSVEAVDHRSAIVARGISSSSSSISTSSSSSSPSHATATSASVASNHSRSQGNGTISLSTESTPPPTLRTNANFIRLTSTTPTTNEVGFLQPNSGRGARDVAENPCDSFTIGNDAKHEFYSPNYPDNYPNQTDCVRVLEAEKGMLLKLDFRDRFDLEPSEDCRFDYLEVRDGQHGYATRLGIWCGKQFPPEITSETRFLWLRFHSDENIEYGGFKAVWSMIPRPTDKGVPPEPESCVMHVTGAEAIIGSGDIKERKKLAERDGVSLDCMWVITVKSNQKVQLHFTEFELQKPNECDANFVDVFDSRTDIPSRLRNFCGSIADLVSSNTNTIYIRYYVEPRAINSSFVCLVTAYRERDRNEKSCKEDEYDCEDARCIAATLKCNHNVNCRFRWDEDEETCGTGDSGSNFNSEHIIIILVVFSLIMFGMIFAFVFNCVRKLIRDHRIIQEHIRQSRENRLDEIGRKTTPCPLSATRVDSRERRGSSESPSLEVAPSKELLPPPPPSSCALMAHEYARELLAREADYTAMEINDIHRSNNASNATQERLQESSEEPETRDNSCQTRESLFDGAPPPRRPTSGSQCSGCGCNPAATCVRHSAMIAAGIPPPPHGWSIHDPRYPAEPPDYLCTYQRFQSPKPTPARENFHSPGKYSRQSTLDSGTTVGSSQHSSGSVPTTQASSGGAQGSLASKLGAGHGNDPRYRAEAVIELPEQERRPFSIESTKSAPDVIATH